MLDGAALVTGVCPDAVSWHTAFMGRADVYWVLVAGTLTLAGPLAGLSFLEGRLPRLSDAAAGWMVVLSVATLLALLVGVASWMWRALGGIRLASRLSWGARPVDAAGLLLAAVRGLVIFTVLGVGLELARVTVALVTGGSVPDGSVLSGVTLMVTLAACSVLEAGRINADVS